MEFDMGMAFFYVQNRIRRHTVKSHGTPCKKIGVPQSNQCFNLGKKLFPQGDNVTGGNDTVTCKNTALWQFGMQCVTSLI